MILIGGSGQNAGKTTLAAALIRVWKDRFPLEVLKVTAIRRPETGCKRGGTGCGACTSLGGQAFALEEELNPDSPKDTSRLLRAGAHQVFWLKATYPALEAGFAAFLEKIPRNALIICESNSLRRAVRPGCFVLLLSDGEMKPTAKEVYPLADLVVPWNPDSPNAEALVSRFAIQPNPRQGPPQISLIR
jgi:hypothetical protein